jgi:SAM-dependent methyltransferase
MNPRITLSEMMRLYTLSDYWEEGYTHYEQSEPIRIANARWYFELVSPHISDAGTLLDVGCATGFFARVAQEKGYSVVGIDSSQRMIDFGKRDGTLDLRCQTIEDAQFPAGSFDVISLWGTDSHFHDPRATFSKILSWLKPGGCFLFNYQDYDHWIRAFFPQIKRGWNVYYNFSARSFGLFAEQLGVRILSETTAVQIFQIHRIARTLQLLRNLPSWIGDRVIKVPTPSYKIVVARKS